ncbi:hypothetical protein PSMK_26790 [Phycisphaera mikurensis NBRC 102666]|uniref:Uncharacterized protein n=1 Tax=Phycisphaera mikurensis (strain NBRC 102666 / KCTC 22515 / FYK2301M01) TaxID=1142394 RepID=I0IHV0_PHYMF|nr:hypothetical protein PSMK_26790 [Phycisphaera mikurensis NBRC 102666]
MCAKELGPESDSVASPRSYHGQGLAARAERRRRSVCLVREGAGSGVGQRGVATQLPRPGAGGES